MGGKETCVDQAATGDNGGEGLRKLILYGCVSSWFFLWITGRMLLPSAYIPNRIASSSGHVKVRRNRLIILSSYQHWCKSSPITTYAPIPYQDSKHSVCNSLHTFYPPFFCPSHLLDVPIWCSPTSIRRVVSVYSSLW